jgi:hypothetical protein
MAGLLSLKNLVDRVLISLKRFCYGYGVVLLSLWAYLHRTVELHFIVCHGKIAIGAMP